MIRCVSILYGYDRNEQEGRLRQPAARLTKAIERTTEEQVFTPDLGGVHDTRAVTNAVKRAL